jgi:hypothetical protein
MSEIEYLYNRVSALEAVVFEMKHGFTVGDKLLITPEFHALMVQREKNSYPFASEYPVGDVIELAKVSFEHPVCHVRSLTGSGIGDIPLDMILRMRLAYLEMKRVA